MIRISIDIDARRAGSLFVGAGTVELHAADRDRFLAALGEAYTALSARDCTKSLCGASQGMLAPREVGK